MVLLGPGNTQIYSPFGTIVVEQRDRGFQYPRLSDLPEPTPAAEPPKAKAGDSELPAAA